MTNEKRGMIAATIGNVIFGFSYLFTGKALLSVDRALSDAGIGEGCDVPMLLALRSLLALLVMGIVILLCRIRISLKGKPVWKLVLLGVFHPVLYFIGETYGLKMTGIIVSSVVMALLPVVSQFASVIFLKEKTSLGQFLFGILSIAGVVAVTLLSSGQTGGATYAVGVLLLLLAIFAATAFSVFGKTVCDIFTPFERTLAMFTVSGISFTVYTLFALGGRVSVFVAPLADPAFLLRLVYLGGLSSVLAFFCTNTAKKHLSVTREAVFSNIITVVSTASGFLFQPTGQSPWLVIAICAVIVAGVVGVQLTAPKVPVLKENGKDPVEKQELSKN